MTKKKQASGVNDDLTAFVTHEGQRIDIDRTDFMQMLSGYQRVMDCMSKSGMIASDTEDYKFIVRDGDVLVLIDDESYELMSKVEVEILLKKYFIPYQLGLVLPRPGYIIQNLNVPFERGESKPILIPGASGPTEYRATNKYKDYPYQSVIVATDEEHEEDLFKVVYVADDYARVIIDGTSKNGYVRGVLYNKTMYHLIQPHEIFAVTSSDVWELLDMGKMTHAWFKYSEDESVAPPLNLIKP